MAVMHCLDCGTLSRKSRCPICTSAFRRMRNSYPMQRLRDAVKLRDGLACAECGSTDNLQVHHVPTPDGRIVADPDYMVTLCARCHAEPSGIA